MLSKAGGTHDETSYPLKRQFELDHKLSELKKLGVKIFSLWNGVVMGQGVGFSITSDYRIACENTLLAMPEVRIGTFADVGVSYYFARLEYEIGRHMATLGYRLRDSRVFFSGIANCFVPFESFAELEKEIIEMGSDSPILKQGMNYKAEELEEGLEWIGYACICQELMTQSRNDIRSLKDIHHKLLTKLEKSQKPIIKNGLDSFLGIFSSEVLKGGTIFLK
jgi:enoyl-CoA hydratase/carnithine racemase